MTSLERKQSEFETLNSAYLLMRADRADTAVLLAVLRHVNNAHAAYTLELHQTIAAATTGKEATA